MLYQFDSLGDHLFYEKKRIMTRHKT